MRFHIKITFFNDNNIMSKEYNSVVRNEATTESKQKANLFNNSISYDALREKSKNDDDVPVKAGGITDADKNVMDEIMKNLDNMKTTETDMLFQYMANPDKLVAKDNVQLFEKPVINGSSYQTNQYDKSARTETERPKYTEHINDYVNTNIQEPQAYQEPQNYTFEPQQPKASSYGPSYGDGQSFVGNDMSGQGDDRFCGFASEDELNIAKLNMLRQLGELTQHGVKLSQNYSMKSDYKAMKYENDLHRSIRDKHNGTKWLGNFLLNGCWGIELANENFNPFEFKLKGWSDQMNDDIDDYYDVLGELYEKWFKSGKPIPPELKLIFMVGGSAIKFHIANTALGKIPTLSEALKQNPALAKKLNEQAVSEKVKEKFEKRSTEQHQNAMKQAEDLQMLKQKEMEYREAQAKAQTDEAQQLIQQQMMQQQYLQQQMMQQQVMQQQLLNKQKQLEELQKQLVNQRSDSRSMYSNNSSVKKSKPSTKTQVSQQQQQEQQQQFMKQQQAQQFMKQQQQQAQLQQQQFQSQQTMQMPTIPASLRNKYSQAQVINPPTKSFSYNSNNNANVGSGKILTQKDEDRDNVSFDPEIDNLLNAGFDTQSRVSSKSNKSSSSSKVSKASNKSTRSRKKPTIKINTK